MNKNYLLFMSLLALSFMGCEDDEVNPRTSTPNIPPVIVIPTGPDTTSPGVNITYPAENTSFLVIEYVPIRVNFSEDRKLKRVRVLRTDADGNDKVVLADLDVPENSERSFNWSISLTRAELSLPPGVSTLAYTITVEAEDEGSNVARDQVTVNIHAPDLNKNDFINAYNKVNLYGYMDWMGYVLPKEPKAELGFILFVMVDKDNDVKVSEDEWARFAEDFNVKNQMWTTWDINADMKLTDAEFMKGIDRLNFFTEWDLDRSASLTSDELGGGLFNRWDQNKDALLNRNEYEENFFNYVLFE